MKKCVESKSTATNQIVEDCGTIISKKISFVTRIQLDDVDERI